MREQYNFPGTFKDLAARIAASITPPHPDSRLRAQIIAQIKTRLAGQISIPALENQLSRFPIISTADHFALLNYKLLYNSNLLFAQIARTLKLPFLVVPATGSIPLVNNTWPRGFYFNGRKMNFFSERKSRVPVFLFEDKLAINPGAGISGLVSNLDQVDLTAEQKKFLDYLFFEALDISRVVERFNTFPEQVSVLNYNLRK